LNNLLQQVRNVDTPNKSTVIDKLQELVSTVQRGGGYVEDVTFEIVGAGGYATGVTPGLQDAFHKATGLTNADGTPLLLRVGPGQSQQLLQDRKAFIKMARSVANPSGNPRGPGGNPQVLVVDPLLVDPMGGLLERENAASGSMQEAWLGALMVAKI